MTPEEPNLKLLPKEEIHLQHMGDHHVAAGLHELHGYVYWTKIALSDLPNDLVSVEDLERFGITGWGDRTTVS